MIKELEQTSSIQNQSSRLTGNDWNTHQLQIIKLTSSQGNNATAAILLVDFYKTE